MIKTLNPSLTSIEKKYLVLSDFWCRMNNIRVKSVECIPLEDGSCDSKLILEPSTAFSIRSYILCSVSNTKTLSTCLKTTE